MQFRRFPPEDPFRFFIRLKLTLAAPVEISVANDLVRLRLREDHSKVILEGVIWKLLSIFAESGGNEINDSYFHTIFYDFYDLHVL